MPTHRFIDIDGGECMLDTTHLDDRDMKNLSGISSNEMGNRHHEIGGNFACQIRKCLINIVGKC